MPEKPLKAVLENLFVSMQKDPEQRKRSALMELSFLLDHFLLQLSCLVAL